MDEETMFPETMRAGEKLLDDLEEFQDKLESVEVDNETINRIKEELLESLHTIKSLQMTIDIPRKNTSTMLLAEIRNHHLQDLDITNYAKEFFQKTKELEVLQIKEVTKLKQTIVNLILAYNEYEEAIKLKDINTNLKVQRKKTLGPLPKKILDDKKDTEKARIAVDYEEAKNIKDPLDKKTRIAVLKRQFKNLYESETEAKKEFKQITGGETL